MVFRRRSSTPPDPLAAVDPDRLPAIYRAPVLEARLATAVARAAESVLTSPASISTEIESLAGDLDRLVVELETLDAATTELG